MGYYSTVLDPTTSSCTTFITPFGKFKYKRLPMGISTAPDEFQARMTNLLGDLPFIRIYLDDLIAIA